MFFTERKYNNKQTKGEKKEKKKLNVITKWRDIYYVYFVFKGDCECEFEYFVFVVIAFVCPLILVQNI